MALAIFDLDNTLLAGDSDYLWGRFLAAKGAVDGANYEAENERFFQEYKDGQLDIMEFLRFSLRPLKQHERKQLIGWRNEFIVEQIDPIISQAAKDLVNKHRDAGDQLLIITATNSFVTLPIAQRFDIVNLIATEPEVIDGNFTGAITGEACFRQGKVKRLQQWLGKHDEKLKESWFYSDSHNDLPLLELVSYPVAVDPDKQLEHIAKQRSWPILRLHQ